MNMVAHCLVLLVGIVGGTPGQRYNPSGLLGITTKSLSTFNPNLEIIVMPQPLHFPFRLQGRGVRLHLFLAGSSGVLSFFLAFEGPFWGFCYEIISWRAW
jgi:hypothetical protein